MVNESQWFSARDFYHMQREHCAEIQVWENTTAHLHNNGVSPSCGFGGVDLNLNNSRI